MELLRAGTGSIAGNPGAPHPCDPCRLFVSGEIIIHGVFRISLNGVVEGRDLAVRVIQPKLFGLRLGRMTAISPFNPSALHGPLREKRQQVTDVRDLHDLQYSHLRTFIPRPSCLRFRFSNAPRFNCCDENLAASIISHRFHRVCEEINILG